MKGFLIFIGIIFVILGPLFLGVIPMLLGFILIAIACLINEPPKPPSPPPTTERWA